MGRNEPFKKASERLKKLFKEHPEYREKMSEKKIKNWQDTSYRENQLIARKNSQLYQNRKHKQKETLKQTYINKPEVKQQISDTLKQTYLSNPEIIERQKETYKKRFNAEERSIRARKAGLKSLKSQKSPSSIEKIIAEELKKHNVDYSQQVVMLERFKVDFLINDDIVIECDGDYWHNLPNIKEKDKIRDELLTKNGFKVFRFWEHEIKKDASKCVEIVIKHF